MGGGDSPRMPRFVKGGVAEERPGTGGSLHAEHVAEAEALS